MAAALGCVSWHLRVHKLLALHPTNTAGWLDGLAEPLRREARHLRPKDPYPARSQPARKAQGLPPVQPPGPATTAPSVALLLKRRASPCRPPVSSTPLFAMLANVSSHLRSTATTPVEMFVPSCLPTVASPPSPPVRSSWCGHGFSWHWPGAEGKHCLTALKRPVTHSSQGFSEQAGRCADAGFCRWRAVIETGRHKAGFRRPSIHKLWQQSGHGYVLRWVRP